MPTETAAIAITTVASEADAVRIARLLVEGHDAACVSITGPMRSIYRWQGEIEDAREWLLLIKAPASSMPGLETRLKVIHPYEVPEWLVFPAAHVSSSYFEWLSSSTCKSP